MTANQALCKIIEIQKDEHLLSLSPLDMLVEINKVALSVISSPSDNTQSIDITAKEFFKAARLKDSFDGTYKYATFTDFINSFKKERLEGADVGTGIKNFPVIVSDNTQIRDSKGDVKSSTNSEMGSYHWFHTLVARVMHIGEYLKDKTPTEEILREWGKVCQDTGKELMEGYNLTY